MLENLIEARNLISDHHHWTHEVYAVDNKGKEVDPTSDKACRWCADGALGRVYNGFRGNYWDTYYTLNQKALLLFGENFISTNDRLGRKAVLAVFDAVINDL